MKWIDKHRVTPSGCWEWTEYRSPKGYGRGRFGGVKKLAHRAYFEHYVGPIPDGLTIDHLCRNKSCVNPAHLEAVTMEENIRRIPPKTHCVHGHEFTDENTLESGGKRFCRACKKGKDAAYRLRLGYSPRIPK